MKKLLLLLILSSFLYPQRVFQKGDKWVYEKKSVSGSDTTSSLIIKEILDSAKTHNAEHYYFVTRVNDYPYNSYSIEEWSFLLDELKITFTSPQRTYHPVYDADQQDFYDEQYNATEFSYTGTETLFDSVETKYQYRGLVWPNISNFQSKYSPEIGLYYLYYFHLEEPYSNYSYTLKAANLGGRIYGDENLLNLWKASSFPPHAVFNVGDRWIYQRNRIMNGIKITTNIEKRLINNFGILAVKETPGDNIWVEKWEILSDSAFITFSSNTLRNETRQKVYSSQEKDYYFKMIGIINYRSNKNDRFLGELFNYQHRFDYNYGYWRMPTPKQTETIYSPEIGLLYLYHYDFDYDSLHRGIIYFDDDYKLKAASIGGRIYGDYSLLTSAERSGNMIFDFRLNQNYPNPFNPTTTISYSIPHQSFVELKVYDMLGREVTTLANKEQSAGEYSVQFNASSLASGVYVYSIKAGENVNSRKFILLK